MNTLAIVLRGYETTVDAALNTLMWGVVYHPGSRDDVIKDIVLISCVTSHDTQRAALQQLIRDLDMFNPE